MWKASIDSETTRMLSMKVDIHVPVLKGQNSKLLFGKKMNHFITFFLI